MRKLMTVATLLTLAAVSCGFSNLDIEFSQGVRRGEPVIEAVAKLGPPIQIAYAQGQKIYYWPGRNLAGEACKIWGAAQRGIIVNWGYQSCGF